MNGSKPDADELFRRIANLSSETEWTSDETREALSESGVRPEDIAEQVLQLVSRLKKESPFYWKARAHATRDELLEKVRAKVRADIAELTRPQLLQKLNIAIERLPNHPAAGYAVAFRKFEDATEEDLRSMLEEVTLIDELERDEQT